MRPVGATHSVTRSSCHAAVHVDAGRWVLSWSHSVLDNEAVVCCLHATGSMHAAGDQGQHSYVHTGLALTALAHIHGVVRPQANTLH